jgi:hypothetical protein
MKLIKEIDFRRVGEAITNNIWLKVISLFLAILLWAYLSSEILKGVKL